MMEQSVSEITNAVLLESAEVFRESYSVLSTMAETYELSPFCLVKPAARGMIYVVLFGLIIFVLNIVTRDYSWVDRIWSILPTLFQINILVHRKICFNDAISVRQWLMFAMVAVWGARLTYNFYRKGGYGKGGEDYRWRYIRTHYHWALVFFLNATFISFIQIFLLLLIASPIYKADAPLTSIDYILAGLWFLFFVGEVTADQQQWEFQKKKIAFLSRNAENITRIPYPYRVGFVHSGLWAYSRHPNFLCEILMWWIIGILGFRGFKLTLSTFGALFLTLLFLGSTRLTEKISSSKYPLYEKYS